MQSLSGVNSEGSCFRGVFVGTNYPNSSLGTMASFLYSTLSVFSTTWLRKLISACLLCFSFLAHVYAQNRSEEVGTLLNFRDANTFSSKGYWNTWNESEENPCAWVGVTCTNNHTVWQLDFSGWGVFDVNSQGLSFATLSNLKDLRQLDLSSNNVGNIPDDIGTLTQLTRLDLSQNQLFTTIPTNISSCRSLRFLSLQQNQLTGDIPNLRSLVNLQSLFLGDNFLSGLFPRELGELRHLVEVDLSNNDLNGTIPALPHLSSLLRLKLDNNSFTGFEEPWFLGPSSSLQHLSASFNQLDGVIPSNVTTLLSLELLDLSRNRLSGQIPSGFSQLYRNNFFLDLSQNQLQGRIPADMLQQNSGESASTCASVNVSRNLLTGGIPIDGANYLCFSFLDLSHNNLSGIIPVNIFTRADNLIQYLWLEYNHLSGDIVEVMVQGLGTEACFYRTYEVRAHGNLFTGDLSRTANCTNFHLQVLDLSDNNLRWSTSTAIPDPIWATLEQLTSTGRLIEFRAGGNNFSGTSLPRACFVSQSSYSGPNVQFNVLDISNNHLDGNILAAAFNSTCLPSLRYLDLSKNDITGPCPEDIILIQSLESFDVSNNNLSGALPYIPPNSSLFNPSIFSGNSELCGYPLFPCPQAFPKGPSGTLGNSGNSGAGALRWWLLLIIIGGSMVVAIGSCLATAWRLRVYRKRHQQDEDLIRTLMERDAATLMSLRELKKATDNFAESAQIGKGGFGIVYKGKLNDGTTVAIKRSRREGVDKDKEQFLNEVRILSQVSHRNLVKLLGCCLENKIALLVFEFVSNGTLQEHLQGKIGTVPLTWEQRLKIAVQTADALNYLHSAAAFPIFHRDVKSANILLNEDLDAKVADFGISRLAPLEATHVSTMAIHGTIGYMDPEYYTSYRLTDKSDVYGFGVVLLELISARPAIDTDADGQKAGLVNIAIPYIKNTDLRSLIDPALMKTYSDLTGHVRESVINVGKLAMKCLDLQSKVRPSMSEVLNELQTLWLELRATTQQMDTVIEDENRDGMDPQQDHMCFFPNSVSGDSTNPPTQTDSSGIEMFNFFRRQSSSQRS